MLAKRKTKRLQIEGLSLWAVQVEFDGILHRDSRTLLITTPRKVIERAIAKARLFMKKYPDSYPKASVVGVEYKGELDA